MAAVRFRPQVVGKTPCRLGMLSRCMDKPPACREVCNLTATYHVLLLPQVWEPGGSNSNPHDIDVPLPLRPVDSISSVLFSGRGES